MLLKDLLNKQHLSDSQVRFLKENMLNDIKSSFWYHNRRMLRLYRWLPQCKFKEQWLNFTIDIFLRFYFEKKIDCPDYHELVIEEYQLIDSYLRKLGVNIHVDGVGDIAGWGFLDASYSSTFGYDRRINLSSGVCFLSHVLCRCLQPYIIEIQINEQVPFYAKWYFRRQLKKVVVAHVAQIHAFSLSKVSFIPEDDSLLSGMERFVISHELGHAYFESVSFSDWPFPTSPSLNIKNRMDEDEEVRADIFAVHVLYAMSQEAPEDKLLLFGPIFLFLFYAWLVDANLMKDACYHPSHQERWKYIMDEVFHLSPNLPYNQYIERLNEVWSAHKKSIVSSASRILKKKEKDEAILDRVGQWVKFVFGYLEKKE